jgi:aquaporin Z
LQGKCFTYSFSIFRDIYFLYIMRAVDIKVFSGSNGLIELKASFKKNWIHYLQEALGLAIFMLSACFFGGMLESKTSSWHIAIPNNFERIVIMGIMMGFTALFIFYSPFTAPSGSHINPAVTITFLRIGKMNKWDSFFYIIFQFAGGISAVYLIAMIMGDTLKAKPVNYVATVPGKFGVLPAAITEFIIAFIIIMMVLFTSADEKLKKYTRIISACLVCLYVIVAGPISGFSMNPARTFASAFPAHTYTAFWIYMIIPFAGMLTAAEFFLFIKKQK